MDSNGFFNISEDYDQENHVVLIHVASFWDPPKDSNPNIYPASKSRLKQHVRENLDI